MATINQNEDMTDIFQKEQVEIKTRKLDNKKIIGLATATVLMGGSALAWGLSQDKSDDGSVGEKPVTDSTKITTPVDSTTVIQHEKITALSNATIKPSTEIAIAHKITETMTYEQAFEVAHNEVGPGGIFTWHGNVYNTYYKEEWQALSLIQRQEFLKDCGYKATVAGNHDNSTQMETVTNPIYIETIVNGQRVTGIDFDGDGIIDNIVILQNDGLTCKYLDNDGNQGLDTIYLFDPVTQQTKLIETIKHPVIVTNDSFEKFAEDSLVAEIMNALLNDDAIINDNIDDNVSDDEYNNDENIEGKEDNTIILEEYDNDANVDLME